MKNKNCESCMMPLAKDGGVSGSDRYCSYCCKDGKLSYEGTDLKEFQKATYEAMISKGMNKWMAKFYTWMIKFAPRWKKA